MADVAIAVTPENGRWETPAETFCRRVESLANHLRVYPTSHRVLAHMVVQDLDEVIRQYREAIRG